MRSIGLRRALRHLGAHLPLPARDRLRPLGRLVGVAAAPGEWWKSSTPPWSGISREERHAPVRCNICRWTGDRFIGEAHSESAECPRCGAIARDRFLVWCFLDRHPHPGGSRILETSPRLGVHYRQYMRTWFAYRASDFDLSMHAADIKLDLQRIDLPDATLDVVLTPHVLEHVPNTAKALDELFRVIVPGGRMYLQVPLLTGATQVPKEPEFHADNTPVCFNFGWDLTDQLRSAGFETRVLVPEQYRSWLAGEEPPPGSNGDGFLIESLLEHVRPSDIVAAADRRQCEQLGFRPPYHFATWECRRP